jgi:hypothetical protein
VCEISLDQRALDAGVLDAMLPTHARDRERRARETTSRVEWKQIWSIEPRPFDPV